jgi:peptidoglycan hydrolase-like amidase
MAWQVYDLNDTLLASIPAETEIKFFYSNTTAKYSFDFVDKTIRIDSYLKLNNFNNGIFTVTSLQDSPTWNRSINYNKFSGDLEIRHNDYKDRTWLIETLPLEDYVRGIKETSNYDPIEYLKTMTVAARTYALYHHNTGTKHAKEFYDVDSLYDQVYKGYVVRDVLPNLQKAVDGTKGIVGTYNDELIIAPYFARSDGRTRSYQEVWYRDVPYLVSVKTPYTEGKTMFGHGVGIDATDARERAENDGWTYDQLVKYYYTGVKLEKIY